MDLLPVFHVKQEDNSDEGENYDSLISFGFDVNIKVENATTSDEIDWCVDNCALFGNNNYINVYDNLTEFDEQKCLRCHKKFDDIFSLLQHNVTHLTINLTSCFGSYKHCCPGCGTYFPSADLFKAHKSQCKKSSSSVHKTDMRRCSECNKVFTYTNWHAHIREVHSLKKVSCEICNKEFKCQTYLRKHKLYVHEGHRPSWRFYTVKDTNEKCDLCPAIFKNKNSLKCHINNCHSDGEYHCDICKVKFKSKPYLYTHMNRVHDGDGKKYLCLCGKSYKSPRRLRIHKKNTICGST